MDKVKALSDVDIRKILNNMVNVVLYSDLHKYNSIDDLLGKYGRAIILYIFSENELGKAKGHWVSVLKTSRNTIEFFCSYGTIPDKTLMKLPLKLRKKFNEDYSYISKLMYDSKLPIEYNEKPLQQHHSVVCGYYCIGRVCVPDMKIEEFQKLFSKNKKSNDELIYKIVSPELFRNQL